jgi:hypothetical protein
MTFNVAVEGTAASVASSRNTKINPSKGSSGKGTAPLSSSSSPSHSPNHKKKQLRLERKLQVEQQHRYHRFLLRMILVFYVMIVTTIVVFYIIAKPQQFYFIWSNASLANPNQPNNMKDILLQQQQKQSSFSPTPPPTSLLTSSNHHQENVEEFVEVGVGPSTTIIDGVAAVSHTANIAQSTGMKSNAAASMVVEGTRIQTTTTMPKDTQPLPSFAFQMGVVLGVGFIQCSTIHGLGGVPPASSSSSKTATSSNFDNNLDENGIPITNIIMPQSTYYSNDVIFLGRRFFRNNHFLTRDLKHGGNVPITHTDIERHAIYDYCRTAEQQLGYIDSIIALDIDHTTSTLYISNILNELLRVRRISALPVAAIVTPERSSQTILDWIMFGDRYTLMNHVARHWIPISAGPYIFQAIADDQYDDGLTGVFDTADDLRLGNQNITKMDTTGSASDIGPSISLPSSSMFRQIDHWPIFMISGIEDTISQEAGQLLSSNEQYHSMEYTKHSILPGNTTCYLYHASMVIVAIIDYLQDWEKQHPNDDNDYDDYGDEATNDHHRYDSVTNHKEANDERLCAADKYENPYVANIFPV